MANVQHSSLSGSDLHSAAAPLVDSNGNELIIGTATGSAVNEFTIVNAAAGNHPNLSTSGSDTNINILLTPKGTGTVNSVGPFQGVPAVRTSGSADYFGVTSPADTTLAASTEAIGVNFDLSATRQWTAGSTIANQRELRVQSPTYAFTGANTITDGSTFSIEGPPTAGTNATITLPWALNIESGNIASRGIIHVQRSNSLFALQALGTSAGTTQGILFGASNYFRFYLNNAIVLGVDTGGTYIPSDHQYQFNSNTAASAGNDTGLARNAAGVIRATNASTAIHGFFGGGASVASATALPVPTGRVFHVTGTTDVTSITSTNFATGTVITLIFDGVITNFTDGSNLKLASTMSTTADDTLTLVYDGTDWYEIARSVN